jgi:hypothetical protein
MPKLEARAWFSVTVTCVRFPFKKCGEETEDVHRGSEIPLLYDVVMGILRYLLRRLAVMMIY